MLAQDHFGPRGSLPFGAPSPAVSARVDEDGVIAYALATNDPNPLCVKGLAVSPVYTGGLVQAAIVAFDFAADWWATLVRDVKASVHGEHDITFLGEVRPGMRLTYTVEGYSLRQRSTGAIFTRRMVVRDAEDGAPLVEHLWANFLAGGKIDVPLGPDLRDHTFPEPARSRHVGTYTTHLALDQSFRYAGAAGDRVHHSIDDEQARAEGFPGKIMQGMGTFAICSGGVVQLAAAGDPRRLTRLAARFAAPVPTKQDLTVEVYEAGRTEAGTCAFAFEAFAGGVAVVKNGWAEVRH